MFQQFTAIQAYPYIPIKNVADSVVTTKSFLFAQDHRIFQLESSKVVQEWKLGFSGMKEKISSISYIPTSSMIESISIQENNHTLKKSKKNFQNLESILICGTYDSKVFLWHENKLKSEWNIPSGGKVIFISSHPDRNGNILVLTDSFSDPLYNINIFGEKQSTIKNVSSTYYSIIRGEKISSLISFISGEQTLLAIGTHTGLINIIDIETMDLKKTLIGHATQVNRLSFQHSFLVSAAESDPHINIYRINDESNKPFKTFQSPGEVAAVDIVHGFDTSKNEIIDVAAICDSNEARIWRIKNDKNHDLTYYNHCCSIDLKKKSGNILAISLSNVGSEGTIVFGSNSQPHFANIPLKKKHISLDKLKVNDKINIQKQPDVDISKVSIVGVNFGAEIVDSWSDLKISNVSNSSLQKRLEEIPALSEGNQFQRMAQANFPTFNISQTLQQLVRTKRFHDQRMLDILDISDIEIINSAVKSISEDYIFSFFTFLHNTIMNQELEYWRIENLYLWINSILINQPNQLQEVDSIGKILKNAIHNIERKSQSYLNMLEVSGRLDLLLGSAGHKIASFDPLKDQNIQSKKVIDTDITIDDESDDEISHIIRDEYDEENDMDELNLMTDGI